MNSRIQPDTASLFNGFEMINQFNFKQYINELLKGTLDLV